MSFVTRCGRWSLVRQAGALLLTAMVAFGVAVVLGRPWQVVEGWWAVSLAGGLCLAGATVALAIQVCWAEPSQALAALGLGMLVRMTVPLGGGLAIALSSPALHKAGLMYYLAAFYLVTLAMETFLVVGRLQSTAASTSPTSR